VTTLANPEIVDEIREQVQRDKVARGEVPRELSPEEMEEIRSFGQAE
jgi:acetyl-CoA synthetase